MCNMFVYPARLYVGLVCFFFFKQKTAYEMRISDWSSDVCSSDLIVPASRLVVPVSETRVPPGERGSQFSARSRPASPVPEGISETMSDASSVMPADDRLRADPKRLARWCHPVRSEPTFPFGDRKSVDVGKSVSVRVALGGRRVVKKQNKYNK